MISHKLPEKTLLIATHCTGIMPITEHKSLLIGSKGVRQSEFTSPATGIAGAVHLRVQLMAFSLTSIAPLAVVLLPLDRALNAWFRIGRVTQSIVLAYLLLFLKISSTRVCLFSLRVCSIRDRKSVV